MKAWMHLIIFTLCSCFLSAQETILFEDNFSDNSNYWLIQNNQDAYIRIERDKYVVQTKSDGSIASCFIHPYISIDFAKDFYISCNITSSTENSVYGIKWGGGQELKKDKSYNFTIMGNIKKYMSFSHEQTTLKDIPITVGRIDKISLIKKSSTLEFYINNMKVDSHKFSPVWNENSIGLIVLGSSQVIFDDLKIAYLEIESEPKIKKIINRLPQDTTSPLLLNLPPILSIQDIVFSKNVLNAEDSAQLSITLKNIGQGDAKNVSVNLTTDITGLQFRAKTSFPVIARNGGTQTIRVDIKSGLNLPTAEAMLKIEVTEPNFKVKLQGKQVKFLTQEFLKPELVLAKFAVLENLSANPNNQIDINEQIDVKFVVQNIGQGNAEKINVSITNNQLGVMLLGLVDERGNLVRRNPDYPSIISGKYQTITYRYFINSEFTSNQLVFGIASTEKHNKYGFSQTKSVEINKVLQEEGSIRTVVTNDVVPNRKIIIEDIPDFISDVDQNIPTNIAANSKTFSVVIGNETYTKAISVKYALNDSRIFKQYLMKTLGLPADHIQYIENATFGQILDALDWINKVIKVHDGQAKVIFYYAGHGMPHEETNSAYLLPVDGNSQNLATAVKLADVYGKLGEFPSSAVTVFLDACFSGSTRETTEAMLVQGRSVKIRPNEDALPGNLVVFSAATGDETAFPYAEKQHGLFTYFLLKKLQESKGNVTLMELGDYIIRSVTQQSLVVNKKSQTPQVRSSPQIQTIWQKYMLK